MAARANCTKCLQVLRDAYVSTSIQDACKVDLFNQSSKPNRWNNIFVARQLYCSGRNTSWEKRQKHNSMTRLHSSNTVTLRIQCCSDWCLIATMLHRNRYKFLVPLYDSVVYQSCNDPFFVLVPSSPASTLDEASVFRSVCKRKKGHSSYPDLIAPFTSSAEDDWLWKKAKNTYNFRDHSIQYNFMADQGQIEWEEDLNFSKRARS